MGFLRSERANAGILFVLGVSAMVTAATMSVDLVRHVGVQGRLARSTIAIADYASREPEVDCIELRALARLLQVNGLGAESLGLLALTSATGDADATDGFVENWTWDPPYVLGSGDSARLESCRSRLQANRNETLGALALADGEVVAMAQLCYAPAQEWYFLPTWMHSVAGQDLYWYHVLPARGDRLDQVCT